ncbi:histidinol-phosphatase [Desulfuribacillus stibiiarsenatis]|uniref:histidinol-phosphatase n=1 Tax=Desulfuribacillus stibiiarsenatis TaxID=1390249 RepID=UPI00265B21A3|nr:histidinol-phosphatase [Desulfuribacillus stibiiarsenatis]
MITLLTDYHVHIEQGKYDLEWLRKFVNKAKEQGIDDLGISEHAYRFKETKDILFNPWVEKRQTESIEEYLHLLFSAREQGMPIKIGIEMDYIPGKEDVTKLFLDQYQWDYVIGSIHWIDQWGFDLSEMKEEWNKRDVTEVYITYFQNLKKMVDSKLFDIVGHFDVIKIFGHVPEMREELLVVIDDVIQSIKQNNMVVEVSTAGFRKPVKEIYPKPQWLEKFFANEIPICLCSDAHAPNDVGSGYSDALQIISEIGYKQLAVFEQRNFQLKDIKS